MLRQDLLFEVAILIYDLLRHCEFFCVRCRYIKLTTGWVVLSLLSLSRFFTCNNPSKLLIVTYCGTKLKVDILSNTVGQAIHITIWEADQDILTRIYKIGEVEAQSSSQILAYWINYTRIMPGDHTHVSKLLIKPGQEVHYYRNGFVALYAWSWSKKPSRPSLHFLKLIATSLCQCS